MVVAKIFYSKETQELSKSIEIIILNNILLFYLLPSKYFQLIKIA